LNPEIVHIFYVIKMHEIHKQKSTKDSNSQ
jgi:hypothetical protein